jgi:hypothetical protein
MLRVPVPVPPGADDEEEVLGGIIETEFVDSVEETVTPEVTDAAEVVVMLVLSPGKADIGRGRESENVIPSLS